MAKIEVVHVYFIYKNGVLVYKTRYKKVVENYKKYGKRGKFP